MLGSINLSRDNIALASYIPRGFENYYDNENFLNEIQLFNYRIIELINPRYLIIMSNYCIKMLLATDLSSMSLRGSGLILIPLMIQTQKKLEYYTNQHFL